MFLALRTLIFQRGRLALLGIVIFLLSLMAVMLSGLSSGLVNDGVSGLKRLPVTAFAFAEGTQLDSAFTRSIVDGDQLATWRAQPGVTEAAMLGLSIVNTRNQAGAAFDMTLFGVDPTSFLSPTAGEGEGLGDPDGVVLSASAADAGIAIGDTLTLDRVGTTLRVVGFTTGQDTFGHVDVGYVPLSTWQFLAAGNESPGPVTADTIATVTSDTASAIALTTGSGTSLSDAGVDVAAADAAASTTTRSLETSFGASPGYTAETTTIVLIQVFLYVITALVIGAFFTVWTVQRQHEIAVLRAVGAPTGFLLRDGITQAAAILLAFTAAGLAAALLMAAAMPAEVPFAIEAAPVATALTAMIVLGLVGAALAVGRIVRIDPLAALGGQR